MARLFSFMFVTSGLSKIIAHAEDWLTSLIMDLRFGRVNLKRGDLVMHRLHPKDVMLVVDIRPRHRASTLDALVLIGDETFWIMSSLLVKIDESR